MYAGCPSILFKCSMDKYLEVSLVVKEKVLRFEVSVNNISYNLEVREVCKSFLVLFFCHFFPEAIEKTYDIVCGCYGEKI